MVRGSDDGVVVTGAGVVGAFGVGLPAFAAGLRAGESAIAISCDLELDLCAALGALGCPAALIERARRTTLRGHRGLDWSVFSAVEAWLAAGLHTSPLPGERLGVIVAGSNLARAYQHAMTAKWAAAEASFDPRYALRFLDTDAMAILSELLGARGEGFSVGGASASGNVAIIKAAQLLRMGELDACLVVGALMELAPPELTALRNLGALGRGPCLPFDRRRAGFAVGHGAGSLVLERRASARARGARAQAEIAGGAIVLAAHHGAVPDAPAECAAMRSAMARAQLPVEAVQYVNAHATGSPAGDDAEVAALHETFGAARPWINSSKGLFGHCLTAAGVVECIAVITQIQHGFVHGNPWIEQPIDDELRFVRGAQTAGIEVAISNAFGFGGINSSIVVCGP